MEGPPAPVASPVAPWPAAPVTLFEGESNRRRSPCNGGMISKVCGGGKGTAWGVVVVVAVVSFAGVSGAEDSFGRGVTAVGDRDAIAESRGIQ